MKEISAEPGFDQLMAPWLVGKLLYWDPQGGPSWPTQHKQLADTG